MVLKVSRVPGCFHPKKLESFTPTIRKEPSLDMGTWLVSREKVKGSQPDNSLAYHWDKPDRISLEPSLFWVPDTLETAFSSPWRGVSWLSADGSPLTLVSKPSPWLPKLLCCQVVTVLTLRRFNLKPTSNCSLSGCSYWTGPWFQKDLQSQNRE